jgi:hypothetical protein
MMKSWARLMDFDVAQNDSGRLKGHYWVRCGDEWTIGLWYDEHQYVAGWTWQLIGFEEPFDSNELDEVIELRIERIGESK